MLKPAFPGCISVVASWANMLDKSVESNFSISGIEYHLEGSFSRYHALYILQ